MKFARKFKIPKKFEIRGEIEISVKFLISGEIWKNLLNFEVVVKFLIGFSKIVSNSRAVLKILNHHKIRVEN